MSFPAIHSLPFVLRQSGRLNTNSLGLRLTPVKLAFFSFCIPPRFDLEPNNQNWGLPVAATLWTDRRAAVTIRGRAEWVEQRAYLPKPRKNVALTAISSI